MLECRAKEVAENAGVPADSFAASSSWRKRFLDKYCLALRRKSRIGQNIPADSDQIAREFRLDVLKIIEEEGIVEIYNADETAMNYEYLPTRTYDTRGARAIWIHNAGARYHFSSRDSLEEKILLLWDDFSGRWTSAVEQYAESINVVLMRIPPGCTSTCQPADIIWVKPFSLELRGLWVEYLQQQLRAHRESGAPEKFKLEAPPRATLMTWMTNAWENLSIDTLASGFRKLAIPTDTRAIPLENTRLQAKEVDVLV
ncbi:Hypothetical protein PHPALM_11642 [Phytophthora palmivora]|uniref:HTH CENPB-type domain-containing protein n=1 Tax=Phytophthora palmivora TaxID=4796 RepID=A0A2P4Y1R0_9STRA|nr:Hypothetical protein PHPALM_11642 [Phytophthora palmivora]